MSQWAEEVVKGSPALKKVFARGAFSSEGLDRYKLFNLLRKGKPVLAAKAT